jgi:hypothetical protein
MFSRCCLILTLTLLLAGCNGQQSRESLLLPMPGVEITAEQVLRDIMLAYWPRQSWQPYLSQQELRMEDDGVERLISNHDGKLVYRIKYHGENSQRWYSSLSLEQLQLNYHLVITPIDEQQ